MKLLTRLFAAALFAAWHALAWVVRVRMVRR